MTDMTDILKVFEYNQHFVDMMNIINMARLNPLESGHKHHIIPKCWFRKNNLTIDNSDDNLVLLTEEQHMKVHKLAAMCIIGSDMRSAMGFAVHMLDGSFSGMHHSEESRRKMSESRKGKVPWNKGKHGIYSEESCRKMSESRKGKVPWNKGKKGLQVPWNKGKKGLQVAWNKGIHQKEIKQRGEY